jgi:hypothetical protein
LGELGANTIHGVRAKNQPERRIPGPRNGNDRSDGQGRIAGLLSIALISVLSSFPLVEAYAWMTRSARWSEPPERKLVRK